MIVTIILRFNITNEKEESKIKVTKKVISHARSQVLTWERVAV